ncbi:MAG: Wzz/FepE/Etk N-terminal domain-containing protein [Betaproteobacteria bacterium]|nr:Wzz/FepE/Etk N-terminal domain-containing protein [Betaproteobacteria bacterium]
MEQRLVEISEMNENGLMQDEINLLDLWEKLRDGWKGVVGGLALGTAIALAGIVLIPPKYEAVALIQVGQIGQVGQVGQGGQTKVSGQPVESPAQAIERMKSPAFQRRVAGVLNDQEWLQDLARSATGTIKAFSLQVIKATAGQDVPLIELNAVGGSPEAAGRKAEVVVGELTKVHDELAQPTLMRLRTDLAISREKLARTERDLVELTKLVEAAEVKDDRFTRLALLNSLRTNKEAETFGQRQMIMTLEAALGAPATQSVHAIEGIFVPEKPASPKKALLLAIGSVGGLFIGICWVFVSDSWRRARASRERG